MSVKLMWTLQGMIIADVISETDDAVELEQPVYAVFGAQSAQLVPILGLTDEKRISISRKELLFNGALVDPEKELRNHYSKQFGSGIQLLNS